MSVFATPFDARLPVENDGAASRVTPTTFLLSKTVEAVVTVMLVAVGVPIIRLGMRPSTFGAAGLMASEQAASVPSAATRSAFLTWFS
jgi:hypothetical protein